MAGRFGHWLAAAAEVSRFPFLITWGTALLVYGRTLAPDLTWANWGHDGGELVAAATTLGIPHPPGYPTYTLLGNLFSQLPFGTLPGRFNLFSAICAGLAAAITAVIAQKKFTLANDTAIITGLTLAFSPLVWGQAIITEVYALNLLAVSLVVWSLVSDRPPEQTGLLLGLALTTHLTSILLFPFVLAQLPRRNWVKLGLGTAVGLTPFLSLPFMAGPEKHIVWGQPSTLSGWWWLVTGQIYQPNLHFLPWPEIPAHLRQWGGLLLAQFTPMGWLALVWGIYVTKSERRQASAQPDSRFLVSAFITALLYLIYAAAYQTNDAAINILPGVLLLTLVMVPGLRLMGRLGWVLPLALLLLNFQTMDLHADWRLRTQTEALLNAAPARAILLTPGDATISAMWAFHHGEGQRPDVILVDSNMFAFAWYRQRLGWNYPDLVGLARDDLPLFEKWNGERRPFCHAAITIETYHLTCNENS